MVSPRNSIAADADAAAERSPASDVYFAARSRTSSVESSAVALAPLSGDGRSIGVSSNVKRQFKDRRIYVNQRTGLPVRPPTSFGLFKHALRRSMTGSKVTFLDFNKRATELWTKMRETEKAPFSQRARELADQYKRVEVRFLRKKVRQMLRHPRRGDTGASSSSSSSSSSTSTSNTSGGAHNNNRRSGSSRHQASGSSSSRGAR